MGDWLPGAVVHPASHDGGQMVGGPARATWHTTESAPGSMAGVVNWLDSQGSWSHLVWDPSNGAITQMIPASRAARALEHPAGTPVTNQAGVVNIQIEVIGRAATPFTDGPMVGLDKILAWLETFGITRRSPSDWLRLADPVWASWNGHVGHEHMPHNVHTDPGHIDWNKLLPVPAPITGDDEMQPGLLKDPDSPAQYVGLNGAWYHVPLMSDLTWYLQNHVGYVPVTADTARSIVASAAVKAVKGAETVADSEPHPNALLTNDHYEKVATITPINPDVEPVDTPGHGDYPGDAAPTDPPQ